MVKAIVRRARLLALAVLALLCVLGAPSAAQRAAGPQPATLAAAARPDPYTPHLPDRALGYHRANRVLLFVGIGWHVLGLLLFLRSGLSTRVRNRVEAFALRLRRSRETDSLARARAPSFVETALYYVAFSSTMLVWSLPIALAGLYVEWVFGFSHESALLFLKDECMALALGWSFTPMVWLGFRLHFRWPSTWWLRYWAILTPLSIVIAIVYPMVVAPLYNRYTPLSPGPLRSRILELAQRAGIGSAQVLVEDTSRRTAHVNAYVTGIGPSTRIVINDTALRELPEDQIVAMVGHEMGHYVEHHVLIGFAVNAVGSAALLAFLSSVVPRLAARCRSAFHLRGVDDLAALPFILLTVYLIGLACAPFWSAISRQMEHRADAFGLRLTGLNDATARLMVGFAERDFSDPDPPPLLHLWFGTHPTLRERIEFARSYVSQAGRKSR